MRHQYNHGSECWRFVCTLRGVSEVVCDSSVFPKDVMVLSGYLSIYTTFSIEGTCPVTCIQLAYTR